jgi:hypothetical protein
VAVLTEWLKANPSCFQALISDYYPRVRGYFGAKLAPVQARIVRF